MNATVPPISFDERKLESFCREHGIRKMCLFGSVLRDDFDQQRSDIDVLVEINSNQTPGWEFYGWGEELSQILGHEVDLHTPKSLSALIREKVLREALPIYERA